jgi:hypothetical protein
MMRLFRRFSGRGDTHDPVADFWEWFGERSPDLLKLTDASGGLAQTLDDNLKTIHPGLVFEFGAVKRPRDFTVSADGIREVFPAVQTVVAAAPALPDWKVHAFRQRGKTEGVVLTFGPHKLGDEDIWFAAAPAPGPSPSVDLALYVRGLPPEKPGAVQEAVYILLDNALGEYDVVTKIRAIDWHPLPSGPQMLGLRPLRELPGFIDTATMGTRS